MYITFSLDYQIASQIGCFSVTQSCLTLCDPHRRQHTRLPCPSLSLGICSNSMSIESVMISNHLVLCHPLLLLPSIFRSIRVFSNETALCIRWLKYWSFSISPSGEYSGFISFRIDWFDLLVVKGNLKSLLQHHRSKTSVLQWSALFMVQISHPCMTAGKNDSFDLWTFVSKVISLLFNTLSSISNTMLYIFSSNSLLIFNSVQLLSHVRLLAPHESQHPRPPCPSPTPRVHSDSCPSSRWCHPAISSSVVPFSSCPQSLPALVFSKESTLRMRWQKYWSFSFSIIPSKEIPGLISFRMDWLDLLAIQGTLKSLLQHHTSKASILWHSQSNSRTHTWPLEIP